MIVRTLERKEFPQLVEMAKEFYAEGAVPGRMIPERFIGFWNNLCNSNCATIFGLIHETEIVGALGAMCYPDFYDGDTVATELFWFVNKDHRGQGLKLFFEFEAWAVKMGAKRIAMIHLKNLSPDVLRKLYLKHGYRELETHFIKDL